MGKNSLINVDQKFQWKSIVKRYLEFCRNTENSMCGICGYIGPNKIEPDILWKMNNTMYIEDLMMVEYGRNRK